MIGVIKTAIITIIISFISGVLLDFYKGLAPRILCSVKKGKPVQAGEKKINSYILNIKNTSNKTIHDLNLNIQGHYDNLKIDDAKITKGLKFDISEENQVYDVSIPFLCKNDEFTARVFAYSHEGSTKKPVITLRSPEKFKKVYTEKENGAVAAICNEVSMHKKAIAAVIAVLVIVYAGITVGEHFGQLGSKVNVDNIKSKINSVKKSSGIDNSSNSGTENKSSGEDSNSNNNTKRKYSSSGSSDSSTSSGSSSKSAGKSSEGNSKESTSSGSESTKEENTTTPANNNSGSEKSSGESGSSESKPAQQSGTQSGTSSSEGTAGNTQNENNK